MSALPQDVQNAIAKDYGNNADVKGVVHDDFVYLVADQHDSAQDVESTILHEAIGHIGVRRLFGTEINQAMNYLYLSIGVLADVVVDKGNMPVFDVSENAGTVGTV
jgi:hypothetical protein